MQTAEARTADHPAPGVTIQAGNIVHGDNSGAGNVYIWRGQEGIYTSSSIGALIQAVKEKGEMLTTDPAAVTYLLHNSLVPAPGTLFQNIYALGVGDWLEFDPARPESQPRFGCDYPYYQRKSTGRSEASTQKLLGLLCASLVKKTGGQGVLMLSSGKDSAAIALAVRETGLAANIPTFTYADARSGYVEEAQDAKAIAARLGLKHTTIEVPTDRAQVREALEHFFIHAPYPSCDPTTVPYAIGLYHAGIRGTNIIDGTRSDMAMGIFPSGSYERLRQYYRLIGGGWQGFQGLRGMIPFHSKLVKFFSTWPEVSLYRHGHFRVSETRKFFDGATDTEPFWMDVYREQKDYSLVDSYTFINDQFFAGCGILPKIKTVAESLDCTAVLPWADADLAAYYFNLPLTQKYDLPSKKNKLLLRRMLKEYLDYDADRIGKRIFYFNMGKFVLDNHNFVRDEILACTLWNENIRRELKKYLKLVERHPRAGGAIMDLFMVSGWHNHCKYLKGNRHAGA